ncbi:type I polyketide synthase [Streptomyces sp. NPDC127074]|uniref:type I polyketide synthase n=1 Tax=Streptomyces sp. NPDC127074 TaxID=3347130 RepID=UPI00365D80E4
MASNEEKLLDYLKRVTADLRQTQRRLKDVESAGHEPVAIVGMSCRFPGGVRSPEELWELVATERDAISELPTDRNWDLENLFHPDPDHPGTSYTREGGFIDDPAGFDATFFGISPREALGMAPQQRLALEASWEAIEHAGVDPESLRGSRTGTFIGCDHLDYCSDASQVPEGSAGYFTIGNSASVVSGRVAYTLGLEGAAVTVDTACSSSLVAMHLACQAIRQGECDMALAGGVAVMSSTAPFIGFSELRGLAPDGRSKAFSANSDGMTLAEGVGVLLLERLSDARRNGHRVLAVIRGTAVNQDGASNGLTAPNGPSQQRVIRQALANARLSPSEVDAVEAHGTGTTLGDPIEAQALLATYGQERDEGRPLWLGSIKSNIGHAQMAAGAAGVIKMVMAMRHEVLPASLHIDEPTPHVDWSAGDVHLLTEAREWPRGEHPRRAGVSSFGISGTNAHLILEQAPEEAETELGDLGAEPVAPVGALMPWVVSARGAEALRGQARALAARVNADPGVSAAEVGWSLLRTRTLFDHRAVVIGQDRAELVAGLEALTAGEPHPSLVHPGQAAEAVGQTVFLFSGQGSQRPGMGAELYDRFPVFAAAFDEVCGLLDPHLEHPLRELIFSSDSEDAALLDHTTYAQAGLFALHIALARLLDSVGVRPDAVIGHSIGEIAAAHVAGVFDLPDACRLVAARATLMGGLAEGGGMVTIAATPDELAEDLARYDGQVGIAALNTPGNTVISGPTDLVTDISNSWAERGRKTRTLTVSHAFHSPLMEPILESFKEAISGLTYHPPTIPLISNLTGQPADEHITTPDYWAQHIRQPVHFHPAITHTAPHTSTYLELGPDPVLATATHHTLHHHTTTTNTEQNNATDRPTPLITSALTRKQPEGQALTHALARLHTAGVEVDWTSWFPVDPPPQVVGLPTYAFQHQRFWLAPPAARTSFGGTAEDPAEAQLWHAIEELDVDALTSTLQLEKGSPGIDALLPALPVLSAWRRQHRERSTLDSWRYRATWQQLPDPATPALTGTWLVVAPAGQEEHPTVRVTVQALQTHGATALPFAVDAQDVDRAALRERLGRLTEKSRPAGVISLLALDQEPLTGHSAVPAGLGATIALLQALGDADISAPLWCVTQGAVATGRSDLLPHPEQSQIWGFGRVAALEHPQRWGGLIDLPATMTHHTAGRLAALLVPGQPEDQTALRTTGTYARRLTRMPAVDTARAPWGPSGTTLITGGTGGLGAQIARWLAHRGAPHLHLVSRSGPDAPGASELSEELTALGTDVTITACDVSDRAALRQLIGTVPAEHPLTAVFHTAGTMELGQISELDPGRLQSVLRSKALAAAHLHDLTQHLDLTAFVLFSSNAATWGSGQQAAYAAANTYLDALAEHRHTRGLPATSLAWGPWGEAGMAADQHTLSHLKRRGLSPLPTDLAIASLHHALTHHDTAVTIADVDWARFGGTFTAQRPSPFLAHLLPSAAEPATRTDTADDNSLRQRLSAAPAAQRQQLLVRHIQTLAATILGHPGLDAIPPAQPFQELGFDSLTAVELRNQLAATTGLPLAPALVFDHPTPNALATYLGAELTGRKAAVTTHTASAAAADEPIAIVGMACRYPGGVRSPEELWELVAAGRDAVGEMPTDRDWDLNTLFDPDPERLGTSYAREGGFLQDAAGFDAAFFGISPREALAMDPQQRLLLETAWETFENAGLDRDTLAGSVTGVFAGGTYQGYGASGSSSAREVEGYLLAGGTPSVMSGRVAYSFGLEGPAVTVDTACSSSLVAMHLAAQALRQGECTMALAGGVTVMATPTTFIEFSRQRGLAADGRCKPFASAADGTGWGEGAGLLLLERLSDARRNGHRVMAVLRGSAVNQDGTSNGLTAPNGPSQQRVIGQALANARLSPAEVDVVEGHGTGTTLGDPIEAQALLATYGQERDEGRPLWLGSIKSNIGHTQAAAGVAGVIKMVMAMRHELLPASLHIDEPTPHVDWSAGDVHLLTEAREWPRGEHPRRAGVSSFGISGTNAHVIVEQAPEEPVAVEAVEAEPVGGPVPWVVSARGAEALRGQAQALAARVNADPGVSATEVGWSLLRTRTLFDQRAVVIGQDRAELVAGLEALVAGEPYPGLVGPGQASETVGQTVFLFSGQGSQRPGMGAELYDRFPIFAEAFDEVCGLLDPHLEHPLRQVVFDADPEHAGLLDHTTYAQAGLFALHIALARLLDSVGVRPDAVIGHSIGEIAAAHIAGVFDLPDACHLVATRATLMGGLPEGGGMATIAATPDELAEDLALYDGQVGIAALNTPGNTVISGPTDLVTDISNSWAERGRKTRTLTVSHAFHSPLMDPILEPFKKAISGLTYHPPTIPLISNLTGQPADDSIATPDYWTQHIRQPVHFHPAITHTAPHTSTYLELGPDPTLTTATHHTLHHHTAENPTNRPTPLTTSTLTRKQPDTQALTHTLARLHTAGIEVDWTSWYPATPTPRTIDLPTYAFQHQHYWLAPPTPRADAKANGHDPAEARLWDAIEELDVDALTSTLQLEKDSPGVDALLPALPVLSTWRRRHRERSTIDSWRYRVAWTQLPDPATAPTLSGTWLLLVPSGLEEHPAVHTAVQALDAHGAAHELLSVDGADARRDGLAPLVSHLPDGSTPEGVLSLLALDQTPHPDHPAVPLGLAATAALVQALSQTAPVAPLWCVTQGAVAAVATDPLPHPHQAQIWGMGRVAALEHPHLWGGLIDLPAVADARTPARIAAVLVPGQPEDQVAIRSTALARRLERAACPDTAATVWRPTGTTLITGGTGGLGAHVARWLAHHGAPHIHLISRSGPDAPGATQLAQELTTLGTTTTITACDATDRTTLQHLLDTIPTEHPLTAVIHAAGIAENTPLAELDLPGIEAVLRPKVFAAGLLHELTEDLDLSAFVLFSSGAASWGGSRQPSYAAANAYLDALAEHRRARGLPATSLAWAPWSDAGMAADEAVVEYYRRRGMRPLDTDLAIASLQHSLDHGDTTVTIADIDWERFPAGFTAQRSSPLLSGLAAAAPPRVDAAPDEAAAVSSSLQRQLATGTPAQQHQLLLHHIQTHAAAILGHPTIDAVPPAQPFQELGFDSLTAVEFGHRLSAATGLDLPPTLVFDHPTPKELADFLRERLVEGELTSEGHLLSELDRWDAVSAPSAVDEAARRRITGRLRLLLAKWSDTERETERSAAHSELETATAEDIFDLISDEFGKS